MKNIRHLIVVDDLYVGIDINGAGHKFISVDFVSDKIRMNQEDALKLAHTIIYLVEDINHQ